MASSPSRVFAALLPAAGDIYRDENEPGMGGHTVTVQRTQNSAREVQVTGSAEASCPADRATVSVSFRNSKESVNDVTNSISRRVEYILQTLRQHHVKGEELTVTRHIYRADDLYHMEALIMLMSRCKNLESSIGSEGGDVATNSAWDTFQRYCCLENSQKVVKTSAATSSLVCQLCCTWELWHRFPNSHVCLNILVCSFMCLKSQSVV
ncbi:interleukin-1 receptor-associated kinase 1-binding protein 1 homolog isoform X2 [Salvelinus fontinalis]|uniref:interleukin-1 receptor-associated kinase 1-binding protein 1 homolog isoform X2 n=1 Tax=Salvelinus fontinalis TaxID=8038 RepID=UPI00248646BC|nr:interleukin-1 receptor-associated kinase 1-binding protein 1 homolog isoform X2 [Salvelinus fontinalis]